MIQCGVKYNAPAGVIMDILQKMVDTANKEKAFTYEWLADNMRFQREREM